VAAAVRRMRETRVVFIECQAGRAQPGLHSDVRIVKRAKSTAYHVPRNKKGSRSCLFLTTKTVCTERVMR